MSESETTLVVGLAGILATLIVSGLGLYYTAKARSSSLRDALFDRQLELAISIAYFQSRARVFLTILAGDDNTFKEQARSDLAQHFKDFCESEEKSSVILPVELWIEVKGLSSAISCLIQEFDESEQIDKKQFRLCIARMTKVALLSRATLGVDELTEQSLSLFSSQKDYSRLATIEIEHLAGIHDQANRNDA
nr:hypothetical protein [Alcaligenes faecalis]